MGTQGRMAIATIFSAAVALTSSISPLAAQGTSNVQADLGDLKELEGPFIYAPDGAPIVGHIVARLVDPQVKFRVCTGRIIEVSSKQLSNTSARCPPSGLVNPAPMLPWSVQGNKLVPLKGFTDDSSVLAAFGSKEINVTDLPPSYQTTIGKVQSGDWAAISFFGEKGEKVFGVISKPNPK
jgi:hypothetical protein